MPDYRDTLAKIKRFDQLVAFLRDPMGWPIESDDFEAITFDYAPEELGIDLKNAAKIQEIKRLRPLSTHQPWGIFFIKFEPRRLPVVALRRILGQVALKKRASANRSERQAWDANDLLFISNYGEGEQRQISFAHFSLPEHSSDLPTLKVLGWDNLDTPLHLDAVARELTGQLAWPEDEEDTAAWRKQWRGAFTLQHREVITTSKRLSIRLAELARNIRDRISAALAIETDKGPLTQLMHAFQDALVHDLDADGFADMYAQTIAYGLLSARIADPHKKTADDFAAHMRTSPFLRELMQHFLHIGGRKGKAGGPGIDFDELGVSDVVELLDTANIEAVIRDFGDRNRQEDPVVHFYELFLNEFDQQERKRRGVYYTPQPVVSYIVRSVHELLQTEFGLADGLADTTTWGEMLKKHPGLKLPPLTDEPGEKRTISPDEPFVQILDPATGTATFLVEVIDVIHRTLAAKWKQQRLTDAQQSTAWNDYVPQHLLPRLHAFELMMAPYAIAHMKIGLKLAETGYRFGTEERARIYLTNALEPWVKQLPLIGFDALAHEAAAVNEIKRHKRFTVVIGNPPYAGHSSNSSEYATGLVHAYHFVDGAPLGERNPKWLQDDYVKFIRFAEHALGHCSLGILGYVTNHSYCDNPTFRGMRRSLMNSFTEIRFLDLHGNSKRKEKNPDGSADENVFDIQQGVAVLLGCIGGREGESVVHADLWGARTAKYAQLAKTSTNSTRFAQLKPTPPFYLFIPQNTTLRSEFEPLPSVTEIFPTNNMGVTTGDDDRFVKFLEREFEDRLRSPRKIQEFSYRPFDTRFLHYDADKLARARFDFMRHMVEHRNLALVTIRRPRNDKVANFFVSDGLTDKCFISSLDNCQLLPLYVLPDSGTFSFYKDAAPNLAPPFLKRLALALNSPQEGAHGLPAGLTPEDIFHYAYAVFHSPGYRSRYAEFLKIDFPRLPLTGSVELFRALARLGGELTALHLLESPQLAQPISEFIGSSCEVTKVGYTDGTVWINASGSKGNTRPGTSGFCGVPEAVWNFHIGGYQVCNKWLKDRKGRTLSKEDITHYHKIVVALSDTIRLMQEIDGVIALHGGWPEAFASAEAPAAEVDTAEARESAEVITIPGESPQQSDMYEIEAPPLREVADPSPRSSRKMSSASSQSGTVERQENPDRDEVICLIRQHFMDGDARARQDAIDELARVLGYQRTGTRIQHTLDDTLRTAVRRGILENSGGSLRIFTRSIQDYDREFLKDQFLAALGGAAWTERDDAIRAFARWLGFRRTGPAINDVARSLINGLLRAGKLESAGTQIRKSRG